MSKIFLENEKRFDRAQIVLRGICGEKGGTEMAAGCGLFDQRIVLFSFLLTQKLSSFNSSRCLLHWKGKEETY